MADAAPPPEAPLVLIGRGGDGGWCWPQMRPRTARPARRHAGDEGPGARAGSDAMMVGVLIGLIVR